MNFSSGRLIKSASMTELETAAPTKRKLCPSVSQTRRRSRPKKILVGTNWHLKPKTNFLLTRQLSLTRFCFCCKKNYLVEFTVCSDSVGCTRPCLHCRCEATVGFPCTARVCCVAVDFLILFIFRYCQRFVVARISAGVNSE